MSEQTINVDGREFLKFHPTYKRIKDGTPRCISCGQIDEDGIHEAKFCPGMGGWLPFPTSTLKIKLKADDGYNAEATHRITIEQWVLITRILNSDDGKVVTPIVDQWGNEVGRDYPAVTDLLKSEAYVDENGTVWTRPTAWAYAAACAAIKLHVTDTADSVQP